MPEERVVRIEGSQCVEGPVADLDAGSSINLRSLIWDADWSRAASAARA